MPRGPTTRDYTGKHAKQFTTHSVTIDLVADFGPTRVGARRVYVINASTSATLVIMTPFSSATLALATGETRDLEIEKILPASKYGKIEITW